MSTFSIRVELYDATWQHYDALHEKLAKIGVVGQVKSDDGVTYKLPPAEYDVATDASITVVRDTVYEVAASVRSNPAVYVTQSSGRSWKGLQSL